jgi:hypothetical protein
MDARGRAGPLTEPGQDEHAPAMATPSQTFRDSACSSRSLVRDGSSGAAGISKRCSRYHQYGTPRHQSV